MSISQLRERWGDGDPVSFRREPPHRGLQYPQVTSQQIQPNFQATVDPRKDVPRPASTPLTAQAEPQKPAAAKRSDIHNLLDNGPSELTPPSKRTSLEGSYTQSAQSPNLFALAYESTRQRQPPRSTTPLATHGSRAQYLPTAASRHSHQHTADYNTPFSGSPAPNASREGWISRFDPRHQSGGAEQTPTQTQKPAAQYGNTNLPPSGLSRLAMELPARQEPSHRSTLGQLQNSSQISSPPPQLSARIAPPFRSASGSSQQQQQHSRVASLGYPQSQTQQLPGQSGSAGSTPVSALHQRPGSLVGYDDQRFGQQREQQIREQQLRDHQLREQEARQRDYDVQQQLQQHQQQQFMQARQQRAQEMDQERYRYPGDPRRTLTPTNGQYTTAPQPPPTQQPPPPQHPGHYRHFSQGGGEDRR